MIDKFIMLSQAPLTNKIFRDWFVGDLIKLFKKNFEFWTINKKLYKNKDPSKVNKHFVKKIRNYSEFNSKIKKYESKKIIFLSLLSLTSENIKFHKRLKIQNFYLMQILWGMMPYDFPNLYERILNKIKLMIEGKKLKVPRSKENYFKIFDLVFYAGNYLKNRSEFLSKKSVKINLIDYEHYVRHKSKKVSNTAVFLDQALTCHSDDESGKNKSHIKYYNSLEKIFLRIEKEYNLKVIIALHPKNFLANKFFMKRKIYKNKTPELVSKSKLVLCHTSISVSYAVLNYKPIIFLDSELIYDYSDYGEDRLIINSLCRYLQANKIYLDKKVDNLNLKLKPNVKLYNKYRDNFIASPTTLGESARRIFLNEIIKLKSLK